MKKEYKQENDGPLSNGQWKRKFQQIEKTENIPAFPY